MPPSVHVVNVPVPLLVRPTIPDGVMTVPGEVSLTLMMQLVELFTTMVVGWQDTVVVVVLTVTVIVVGPELVP